MHGLFWVYFFHFKKENCQMVIQKQDYIEMYF